MLPCQACSIGTPPQLLGPAELLLFLLLPWLWSLSPLLLLSTEAAVTAARTTAKIQQAADHAPSLQLPLPYLDSPAQGNPMSTNLSGVEYKSENGLHICQEVMCNKSSH